MQATPSAHAAANISIALFSFLYMSWNPVTIFPMSVASMHAMWMKGPSFPRGIPEPRVAVRPTTFATSTRKVRYSFRVTPRRIVFISGMPEPGRKVGMLRRCRSFLCKSNMVYVF